MGSGKSLGSVVREARLKKEISLRKFAESLDLSATFVSMIERDEIRSAKEDGGLPISEETLEKIAGELELNLDELLALAGKLPSDLSQIIQKHPKEMAAFLRTARSLSKEQLTRITEEVNQQKKSRGKS